MSFPNLQLVPGHVLHSDATGVADDGDNTFDLGIAEHNIQDNALVFDIFPLDAGVTAASFISRAGTLVTVNFTGSGQVRVRAKVRHTVIR